MEQLRVGIIGAGRIANTMGETLKGMDTARGYAIAARDLDRAEAFAEKWGFEKAYGSYEEMCKDPNVDLVYVATPHSHHMQHVKLCIEYGKPCLCEKSFMCNAREAEEVLALAEQKKVFVTEGIWTRYQPMRKMIMDIIESGVVGKPKLINGSLCYNMTAKKRIFQPELGGGALLDVGVYSINFARMFFGDDIVKVTSSCIIDEASGMDIMNSIVFNYADGRVANLQAGAYCKCSRKGLIACEQGYIEVENINNPQYAVVYDAQYQQIARYDAPKQITGFEYEVEACAEAIRNGWLESPFMPHAESIAVMRQMDALRKEWGVVFPMD